jgi:hypothetical protein
MKQMEERLELAEVKERRMLKLLCIIKKQGVPVEELYKRDCKSTEDFTRPTVKRTEFPRLELEAVGNEDIKGKAYAITYSK